MVKSPSRGQKSMKTPLANPRRSLFKKCFKSWFDTVRWWEMSCAFDFFRNYWFRYFLHRVMAIFSQQKNSGPNAIYSVLGIPAGVGEGIPYGRNQKTWYRYPAANNHASYLAPNQKSNHEVNRSAHMGGLPPEGGLRANVALKRQLHQSRPKIFLRALHSGLKY